MADEPKVQSGKNETQKNFNRMYFWGMVIALLAILGIYYVFAFTNQVHQGHGQSDSGDGGKSMVMVRHATVA